MLEKIVAVDENLNNVKEFLIDKGYQVTGTDDFKNADIVVVSGMDNNMMNMQQTAGEIPVISASGKNEEEILAEITNKIKII